MDIEIGQAEVRGGAEHGVADRDGMARLSSLRQDSFGTFVECSIERFKVSGFDFVGCGEDFADVGTAIAGQAEGADDLVVECRIGAELDHGFGTAQCRIDCTN